MTRISFADMDCPIAQAAEQLADKWKFVIIRNAFNGMRRFDDFAEQLGVASNVLTARLSELVAADILTRVPVDGDGRAVEYRLTAKGHDLFPMLIFLAQWSDRWLKKRGGPRFEITSADTGELVQPMQVTTASGVVVTSKRAQIREGRGRSSVYRDIKDLVDKRRMADDARKASQRRAR